MPSLSDDFPTMQLCYTGGMTREQMKKRAVQAIDRIVAAAKELAEAEAMLWADKDQGELTTAKPTTRRVKQKEKNDE